MTLEQAERQIAEMRERRAPLNRLRDEFPSVPSVEALLQLSDTHVLAAWLHGRSPRAQVDGQVAAGDLSRLQADAALAHVGRIWESQLLGAVYDGEDLCHIVYRSDVSAADEPSEDATRWSREHPSIVTMRRDQAGRWGLLAMDQMFGFGSIMYHIEPATDGTPANEG
jgi:hypothetical protein